MSAQPPSSKGQPAEGGRTAAIAARVHPLAPRRLPHLLWLVVVWVSLWGDLTVANLLSGVLLAVLIVLLFRGVAPRAAAAFRPLPALYYLGFFLRMLVASNITVAIQVLMPTRRVTPGILAVPLTTRSEAIATLVADSITLTPGTLTLDVDPGREPWVIYVHVLNLTDPAEVRDDVYGLERRALAAFGSPSEQAASWRRLVSGKESG